MDAHGGGQGVPHRVALCGETIPCLAAPVVSLAVGRQGRASCRDRLARSSLRSGPLGACYGLRNTFLAHSSPPGSVFGLYALPLDRRQSNPMKLKIRNSKSKKAKKTGFLSRQRTSGGRKVNKRHRSRHGSF